MLGLRGPLQQEIHQVTTSQAYSLTHILDILANLQEAYFNRLQKIVHKVIYNVNGLLDYE